MGMKEMMAEWISKHPDATIEQAWIGGYWASTDAWCSSKRQMMEQCVELMKQIIDK